MDRKEYESYDEIHAKLAEAMQEACTKDEAGDYKSPDIDLSFLNEDPVKKHEKKLKFGRFGKVAAIIIIALLGMNVVMLATDSGVSYSDKGLLHRIYEGARGIFTDKEDKDIIINDSNKVFVMKDFSNINDAKKFWSKLLVPQYIPKEYKFVQLKITQEISGEYWAEYIFTNSDKKIVIGMTSIYDYQNYSSNNQGEVLKLSDKIINVYWDKTSDSYIADIYIDDLAAYVYGHSNRIETKSIATNLN